MKRLLPISSEIPLSAPQDEVLRFGPFRLNRSQRLLLNVGNPVLIGGRALDILNILVDRAGHVVSKEELIAHAWPQTVVEATNLRVHIGALRRALGDGQAPHCYILNVVGRGYSFVAPVTVDNQSTDQVQPAAVPVVSRNFPLALNPLIGRSDDIDQLSALLYIRRLVTIVGGGGLGKTTLALATASRIADRFSDGTYFVDLAVVADPALISHAFVAALGLAVDKKDPIPDLIEFFRDKKLFLLLDNCEHVIEAAARLAESILRSAAGVHILATSREPLSAEGEWQYQLAPLGIPSADNSTTADVVAQCTAVQMFVERALTTTRTFTLTDTNASAVSRICRVLDGNPLAIELTAARLSLLGVHELAERLDDQLFAITNDRRSAVPRHTTLRATLDWSHELLAKPAQIALRRLAIFSAAFTEESAIAVAAQAELTGRDVASAVMSLAVKSLISTDLHANPVRHRLLFATRAYAFEKLTGSEDYPDIFRWHGDYVAKLLRQASLNWETMGRAEWIAQYEYALDDVRAALNWAFSPSGDAAIGADLTALSAGYGYQLGLLDEFHGRVEHALRWLATQSTPQLILETRLKSALASMFIDRAGSKREDIVHADDSSEQTGSPKYQIGPILHRSILQIEEGNYRAAVATARKLSRVAARTGDPLAVLLADRVMAQACHFNGDHGAARGFVERVLDHSAQSLPLSYLTMQIDRKVSMRIVLARILWLEGLAESAVEMSGQALEHASQAGPFALCQALALAACPIAMWRGDFAQAKQLISQLLEQTTRFKIDRWGTYGACYEQVNNARGDRSLAPYPLALELPELGSSQGLIVHTLATIEPEISQALLPRSPLNDATGWCAPELLRLEGIRQLSQDPLDAEALAEALFMKSLNTAVAQRALAWQLRTSMSLAALWKDQGQGDKSRELLSSVYRQFAEGHETRDLRAAAEMLKGLR